MTTRFIIKLIKAKIKVWIKLKIYEAKGLMLYVFLKLWEFLIKRRSIRVFPRLRLWIMKWVAVIGVLWIVLVPVVFQNVNSKEVVIDVKDDFLEQLRDLFTDRIVVESAGAVGLPIEDSASLDTIDGNREVSQEDETPLAIEKIVDIVHQLESSGGKNNFSKCESIGKFNEFGYGIPGDGKYLCFEKGKDREAVIAWFERELENKTVEQALCKYNTGQPTDSCPYVDKFNLLIS